MKKVRLTETKLINLIKNVIRETEEDISDTGNCTINCMPGPISRGDLSQTARANCCSSKKVFSQYCMQYISKYRKDLQDCDKITFVH